MDFLHVHYCFKGTGDMCLQLSSSAVARVGLSLSPSSLHIYQYVIPFMSSFQPSLFLIRYSVMLGM